MLWLWFYLASEPPVLTKAMQMKPHEAAGGDERLRSQLLYL